MAKSIQEAKSFRICAAIRSRGERIVVAGAGSGLTGKTIEAGGADMLMVFNSGKYRMAGHGSLSGWLAFGNANEVAFSMAPTRFCPWSRKCRSSAPALVRM